MKVKENFGAVNINGRDYYVTGRTTFKKTGEVILFDDFKRDPIVCPSIREDEWSRVEYLTCEKLTAADHERENQIAEQHEREMCASWENTPE